MLSSGQLELCLQPHRAAGVTEDDLLACNICNKLCLYFTLCSAGIGRTGTIVVIDVIINTIEILGELCNE